MIQRFSDRYRFLSNFWPVSIEIPEHKFVYPSVEHAYQAHKATAVSIRMLIGYAKAPNVAKRFGNSLNLPAHWNDEYKVALMTRLTALKYKPQSELAEMLCSTFPHKLVEGNWWGDTFWGVCNDVGRNELGSILMMRRDELMGVRTLQLSAPSD